MFGRPPCHLSSSPAVREDAEEDAAVPCLLPSPLPGRGSGIPSRLRNQTARGGAARLIGDPTRAFTAASKHRSFSYQIN